MYPVKPSTSSSLMSFVCLSSPITSPSHLAAEGRGQCPLFMLEMTQTWETHGRHRDRGAPLTSRTGRILRRKTLCHTLKNFQNRKKQKHLFLKRSIRLTDRDCSGASGYSPNLPVECVLYVSSLWVLTQMSHVSSTYVCFRVRRCRRK